MSALARLLALLLLLLLFGAASAETTDDPQRQVLVLLQLAPQHYRPDAQYAGNYASAVGRQARRALAQQLAEKHGLSLVGDWPLPALGVDCYVLQAPAERAPQLVADALARDARVVWAQPMHVYRAQGAGHDDPLYPLQPAALDWHLAALHELADGRGVTVALVDSGVDALHPDLAGRLAASRNFVDNRDAVAERHGTALAGIIAARSDDGGGIAGVAPRARLLALRACWQQRDDETLCTTLALARALQFVLGSNATVVNLSLSGPPDRLLAQLLDALIARGISVVAAADRTLPGGGFPASHAGVLAVSDSASATAWLAPGRDVPVPVPGGRWEFVSGASYASAHVAGLLALLRQLAPGAAPALVRGAGGGVDACASLLGAANRSAGGAPPAGSCAQTLAAGRP